MLRVLVDTCVWLDLVQDYRQRPLLVALGSMIVANEVSIILPRIVVDEFERNKIRIIKDSQRSLASHFRLVKDAVRQFGREADRDSTLTLLNEVDHRIRTLGESVNELIGMVQDLFASATVIETTDAVKLQVVDRAMEDRAPFHRNKNSVDDAILIETYADLVQSERAAGQRFAFVSHNYTDFSATVGDNRVPHPDIAAFFDHDDSTYRLNLLDALRSYSYDWFVDFPEVDLEAFEEPRRLSEILETIEELTEKVWYNRHLGLRADVEGGDIRLIESHTHKPGRRYRRNVIAREIWDGAVASAKKVEAKYPDDLGPWTDFEWGMINGKLSALRWVLGDEWDNLDI